MVKRGGGVIDIKVKTLNPKNFNVAIINSDLNVCR